MDKNGKKLVEFEFVDCNLCRSSDFDVVYNSLDHKESSQNDLSEKYRASSGALITEQVVRCKNCGLVYLNPRPTAEVIVNGYREGTDDDYVSQEEARLVTSKRSIKFIERFTSQKGRILDVGAAAGFFLKVARDSGWEIYGVEPNDWLVQYGQKEYGLNIQATILIDAAFPDGFFDVVTMWDVLEHTPDPSLELAEVYRILKPGGFLVINFPDFNSFWAKIFGRKWWWLLSVHLYYFTPKTLSSMLNKHGYEVLKIKPHFQQLKLDYLLYRFKVYNQTLYRIGDLFVRTFHLSNLQIPYNASQTNLVARKKIN